MRKTVIFSLIFFVILVQLAPFKAQAAWNPPSEPSAEAVYLVNSDTGTVVYEKNADKKVYPASLTKIMTAILTVEAFGDKLDTVVTVKNSDFASLAGTDSSLSGLKGGEQLTVEQLLYCLMLPSGNDTALVLARAVAGDVTSFVDKMNEKAKELGCENTHFMNPHGLHDENHYTTAKDMYLIAKCAMSYDILAKICSTARYDIEATAANNKHILINTNTMLSPGSSYYYKYIRGIKTGYTTPAGDCLMSYASNGGYTYYCAALNAPHRDKLLSSVFSDTKMLYQWAFGNFELKTLVDVGTPQHEIGLELAWGKSKLRLVADRPFSALIPKGSAKDPVKIIPEKNVPSSVMAPVQKGQKLGTAAVMLGDTRIGTINLVADDTYARSKPLYFVYLVGRFFQSIWFRIVSAALIILLTAYILLSFLANRRRRKKVKRSYEKYQYQKYRR